MTVECNCCCCCCCDRLILDILNDSCDAVEVALSRDGNWQVTQTADPDSDNDDDDDEYLFALLPPSEPAAASGSTFCQLFVSSGRQIGFRLKHCVCKKVDALQLLNCYYIWVLDVGKDSSILFLQSQLMDWIIKG